MCVCVCVYYKLFAESAPRVIAAVLLMMHFHLRPRGVDHLMGHKHARRHVPAPLSVLLFGTCVDPADLKKSFLHLLAFTREHKESLVNF